MFKILYLTKGFYIKVPYIHRGLFNSEKEAVSCLNKWFKLGGDGYIFEDILLDENKKDVYKETIYLFGRTQPEEFEVVEIH